MRKRRTRDDGPVRGRRQATLAALVVAGVLAAAAPAAEGAANMEVAVQDDPLFVGDGYYGRSRGIEQARQLGATRIRINVSWAYVLGGAQAGATTAPADPVYDWSAYDALIAATAGRGLRVQIALVGPAPAWATGNRRVGPHKPDPARFAHFVRATVAHYGALVDRYSIWNEPNHVGWLAPLSGGGRHYRAMYVAAYDAIKAANPSAQVLIAETSPYAITRSGKKLATAPLAFLRELTCANATFTRARCGGLVADGYAHHPYDFDHPPSYRFPGADNVTLSGLGRLTSALDRLARAGGLRTPAGAPLDLYLTEYGYFASGARRVPEARRAAYMTQAFAMAQRHPRVRQMLQYLIVQPAPRFRFFDTSLVSANGRTSRTFRALVKWARTALARGAIAREPVVAGAGNPPAPSSDPALTGGTSPYGGAEPEGGDGRSTGGTAPGPGAESGGSGGVVAPRR